MGLTAQGAATPRDLPDFEDGLWLAYDVEDVLDADALLMLFDDLLEVLQDRDPLCRVILPLFALARRGRQRHMETVRRRLVIVVVLVVAAVVPVAVLRPLRLCELVRKQLQALPVRVGRQADRRTDGGAVLARRELHNNIDGRDGVFDGAQVGTPLERQTRLLGRWGYDGRHGAQAHADA